MLAARQSFDAVPNGVYIAAAIIAAPALFPPNLFRKKKRGRSKALYSSTEELADAIEEGAATLDPTLKAIFSDIREKLTDTSDLIADGDTETATETLYDLAYDIDRALSGRTTK